MASLQSYSAGTSNGLWFLAALFVPQAICCSGTKDISTCRELRSFTHSVFIYVLGMRLSCSCCFFQESGIFSSEYKDLLAELERDLTAAAT